jgi:peptidoglycan biosynthesis protein MviN/MurJ (putative lipid II flippase)
VVGIAAAVTNVALSIVLVNVFSLGIVGIAWALSVTTIIETLILGTVLLHKQFPTEEISKAAVSFFKLILLGIVTGLGLWIPMRLLDQFIFDTTRTIPLLILTIMTSIIGMGLYLLLSYVLKIDQLTAVLGLWERIKSWRSYLKAPAQSEPIILPTSEQN